MAFLRGDNPADLDTLGRQHRSGDVTVERSGDNWVLTTAHWNADVDFTVIRDEAGKLVRRLNAVARMLDEDFGAVELTGVFTDGSGVVVFGVTAYAHARAGRGAVVVTDADGNIVALPAPPPSAAPGYVALAQRHGQVAEVLDLFAEPGEWGWVDLYKVFEIVREDVGGEDQLRDAGLALKREIAAFRASANLPSVSGSAARHARGSAGVPKHTMTIGEGRRFIRALVAAWLDRLS